MRLRSTAALRGSVSVKKQVESISAEQGISERSSLLRRDSLSQLPQPLMAVGFKLVLSWPFAGSDSICIIHLVTGKSHLLCFSLWLCEDLSINMFQSGFYLLWKCICWSLFFSLLPPLWGGAGLFFLGPKKLGERWWLKMKTNENQPRCDDDDVWKQMKTNPGAVTMMCAQAPPSAPTWQAWANPPGWSNSGEKH